MHSSVQNLQDTTFQADPLARFKAIAATTNERPRVLITGALGQLGRGLNSVYRYMYGDDCVVMTDILKAPRNASDIFNYFYLDILSQPCIERFVVDHRIDTIVHFSALLSAIGEQNVNLSLQVNCRGVENILEVARKHQLKVFIPSTIGAFGPTTPRDNVPDSTIQAPTTIYGVSKVYAERLGEYYHHKFGVDFRCLRFPGIISTAKPGGGTTDYAIEIFYEALKRGRYTCYLRPDTKLPLMYDTDCMASVVQFLSAPSKSLTHRTYNVTGFSFTPVDIANAIKKIIPHFEIDYSICNVRQSIGTLNGFTFF
uniref:Epimerase domain-containing protein n=1 Tax=Angiostrongylus cantonensis TaxID=6313 RepID=A0A0K0D3K3_ANGCA